MQMSTQAVVIGTRAIDEEDRLLTLLSKEHGVIQAYAKGASRMKSRLAPTTELLCYSNFMLFKNKDRYTVDAADSINMFFGLREDIEKLSLATYFAELTSTIAPQAEGADTFLSLLLNTLFLLEKGRKSGFFLKPVFELRALTLAGYMPNLVACGVCACFLAPHMFLLLQTGGLICEGCLQKQMEAPWEAVSQPLAPGVVTAMRHIIYSPAAKLFAFELPDDSLAILSDTTEKYLIAQTDKNYGTLSFYKSMLI